MPQARSVETTLAAWSLVGGFAANFAGLLLIGRLPWPLSIALIVLGTSGLIGAMLLVAAADRNQRVDRAPPVTATVLVKAQ